MPFALFSFSSVLVCLEMLVAGILVLPVAQKLKAEAVAWAFKLPFTKHMNVRPPPLLLTPARPQNPSLC